MSSFFTQPRSHKKRKRSEPSSSALSNKRHASPVKKSNSSRAQRGLAREESISGSESEEETRQEDAVGEEDEEQENIIENETATERRLRLAEQYLENVRAEAGFDAAGFDAADLDRDIIAQRLKEDVAENKGKIYRRIASDLDISGASRSWFKFDCHGMNAVTIQGNFAYTAGQDLTLCKWELAGSPGTQGQINGEHVQKMTTNSTPRTRPKQLIYTRGNKSRAGDTAYHHHTAEILSIAASEDGKYVVTGGRDKRLIVWEAGTLKALKIFTQHRDSVTGLTFRRGTNQLYSCSADRTIKIWSLDELAYVETLFGHQDSVVSISALAPERCVSVGAQDRTARLWKIGEGSQLVFRGYDPSSASQKKKKPSTKPQNVSDESGAYAEGSIDCVAMVDDNTFITGSNNGSLCLWSIHKKKPVSIYPLAHGSEPPSNIDETTYDLAADIRAKPTPPQPHWITALACIPYSDIFLSGSWDGHIRAWKIGEDMRSIVPLGALCNAKAEEATPITNGHDATAKSPVSGLIRGVINSLAVAERGERGKDGLCVLAGVGKYFRLGRWKKINGRNGACALEVKCVKINHMSDDDIYLNGAT